MGEYKIVFTQKASEDLARIVRYIARQNPTAAIYFGNALAQRAYSLVKNPHRGVNFKSINQVKFLVHRAYLIFYQINEEKFQIIILRYWHSARDFNRLNLHKDR